MPTIICPSCGTELTEFKRFCPECGARLPDPEEPPARPAAAPTVILPPDAAPAAPGATVLLPRAEEPPAAPAPTVRLDAPAEQRPAPTERLDAPAAAPTIMLPPEGAPPPADAPTMIGGAPPATPPPADAPTMIGGAPPADAPTMIGGTPPPITPPPPAQPPAFGGLPPAGTPPAQPPAFGGQLPTGADYPTDQTPGRGRRTLWWLIGGGGCLLLLLVGACALGAVLIFGNAASAGIETAATAMSATSEPLGGGGIVPDDSPLTGGTVLLEDDFSDPDSSDLGVDDNDTSRYAYEGGAYVIEVKEPEMIVWTRVEGSYDDARVEIDAEVPDGADVSAAGLVFHYQDEDNFYLFSVSNDGYYALELLQNNEWIVLIDWTESGAIDASLNRMQVETSGDRITLYVNGELLEETSDGTFTEGEVALAVSSLEDSTAEVRFDNLLIAQNE